MKNILILLAIALITGCSYEVPLTEEHTIPIDQELLGAWMDIEDDAEDLDKRDRIIVMPFSETEYVVCWYTELDSGDPFVLRGYCVKIGAVSCVQLQSIGRRYSESKKPLTEGEKKKRFAVAKYEIRNDLLKVSMLNDKVVSGDLKTSEALREAFLENIANQELFNDPRSFRRYRETNE